MAIASLAKLYLCRQIERCLALDSEVDFFRLRHEMNTHSNSSSIITGKNAIEKTLKTRKKKM